MRKRLFFRSRQRRAKPLIIVALILLVTVLLSVYPENIRKLYTLAAFGQDNYHEIISEGLPGNGLSGGEIMQTDFILHHLIYSITGIDSRSPIGIIGQELNLTSYQAAATVFLSGNIIEEEGGEEDFYLPQQEELDDWISVPQDEIPPVQLNGEPMILIYTTHNAETYKPSDGVSRVEGKNGGVADVSSLLARTIESKYAIKSIYCDAIHDYPDFAKSYINSMQTVQQLLKKYPKLQLVLDIHRDAGMNSRSDTLVNINGTNCAKVMIVIGTEHSRWEENLSFAEKVEVMANKLYPGLIKCIRVRKDRRYNQHLHPRALLLEIGSDLNTREDAMNSTLLMAEVMAEVLKEN